MAEGRRERMREKIRARGAQGLPPHEIIEFMLYPFIPRKDTSPLAKELLKEFKSLDGILEAKEDELLRVKGMPKMAAVTFPMYKELIKVAYEENVLKKEQKIANSKDAGNFCAKLLYYSSVEKVAVVYLNNLDKILGYDIISEGSTTETHFDAKKICKGAVFYQASGIIITHNHPSGNMMPSDEDVSCTQRIQKQLEPLGIKLMDHVIVSGDRYYSMRNNGDIK
ncbi:MAG: RadC family protein [Clostridia bacterium]|nr:RadC family protein [Clostridia bacterium]